MRDASRQDPGERELLRSHDRGLRLRQAIQHGVEGRREGPDLVVGDVLRKLTDREEVDPDFVIVRANGEPLYTLVNPVDDALMQITHVLRGEDLLSSTPRQLAMYEALGAIGAGTSLFTGRGVLFSAFRQTATGYAAALITYGIGNLAGIALN